MAEHVDILIVGSGASGAAAAWSLSNGIKCKIVCLEQGGEGNSSLYPATRIDWELSSFGEYSFKPGVRKSLADYPVDDSCSPISIANYNGFGGSTILYSAHFPRMHPSDFRVYSLDGVASDWPVSYQDLLPFFELNESMMGVAGLVGDPANPSYKKLLPPIPLGQVGVALAGGFNKLGWHWWPSYAAINTHNHGGRARCVNLGPCNTGCAQGAKGSVDVTYWPVAKSNGVEVRVNCRAIEVKLDGSGQASGVIYADQRNALHEINAKIIVLACSGIGTPRLMLNSKSAAYPDGLGNESGLLGKNLMLHPLGYVEGVFDHDLQSNAGPHGACILSQQFYESDSLRNFSRGYTLQVLRGSAPVETATAGYFMRQISLGPNHHRDFLKTYNKNAGIAVISEDLPDPSNRVELDYDNLDSSGMPGVKIFYRLGENTNNILKHGVDSAKKVLEASGAKVTASFAPVKNTGWHLMGTARMGDNPRDSVVNRYGQVHGIKNLFIVDSSIFVTAGAVNPVATAQALTLWSCNHIIRRTGDFL